MIRICKVIEGVSYFIDKTYSSLNKEVEEVINELAEQGYYVQALYKGQLVASKTKTMDFIRYTELGESIKDEI